MDAFEELSTHFREYPAYLAREARAGKKIIATICPHTPRELILAAGGMQVPLTLSHAIGRPEFVREAESHLYLDTCPIPKAFYGALIKKACPGLDLIIAACTCDHRLKTAEVLYHKGYNVFFLSVPRTEDGHALDFFHQECVRVKHEIEKVCGKEITDEDLRQQVESLNRVRTLFGRILVELKYKHYPIPRLFRFMIGCFNFPPERSIPCLEGLLQELHEQDPKENNRPRILSLGSMPFDPIAYYSFLHNNCNLVMADFFRVPTSKALVSTEGDVLLNLARANFEIECECHSPNEKRTDTILKVIHDYRIDGVIYHILKPCQTFGLGGYKILQALELKGIPTLSIDIDYMMENTGQLQTRIEAFFERISG